MSDPKIQSALALLVTKEWQGHIAALAADTAQSLETVVSLELREPGHPFYHGKMSLLRLFRELADMDEQRFSDGVDLFGTIERMKKALQAILAYDTEHNGQLSPVAALAREGLGIPPLEPPPIDQAMAELREKFGHHFDGVDAEQFVREQRDV